MKVCICNNVSDKDIRKLIKSGITDRVSVMQLTNAGTCCRQCIPDINKLIQKHSAECEISPSVFNPIVYTPSQA